MDRTTVDIWVGVFVALGFAALIVLAFKVGNLNSSHVSDGYELFAHFDNIGGLKVRAPVKSAGVVVGRVNNIQFDTKKYDAVVAITIDKRYQFPKDTSASILTSGLLGEQYIGLEAGADRAAFKNGESIRLTQSAVVLEQLIGQFIYGKASEGGKNETSISQ